MVFPLLPVVPDIKSLPVIPEAARERGYPGSDARRAPDKKIPDRAARVRDDGWVGVGFRDDGWWGEAPRSSDRIGEWEFGCERARAG